MPIIKIKPNAVSLAKLSPQAVLAVSIVASVFHDLGHDCIITEVYRPPVKGTRHSMGDAVDFRLNHLDRGTALEIAGLAAEALGTEYDVVAHGEGPNFHLHVEYDPQHL